MTGETFRERLRDPEHRRRLVPWAVLAIMMLASAALVLWLGRGTTFFRDEWSFVSFRENYGPASLLSAHAGHFSLWPVVFFLTLFKGVGLEHYEVYRAAALPLHLLCALLLFLIARRRLGDVLALAPAAILLFLGSSWMDILWPFQIGFTGALAFGMGAVLAVDRDDLKGDAVACLLLLVAIGWSGAALPFLPGIMVGLFVRRRLWTRLWVFGLPLVAYLAWSSKYGEIKVDLFGTLPHLPHYMAKAAGAGLTGITMLPSTIGVILAWAALGGVLVRLVKLRRSSPLGWEALAMGLAFWALTGLARTQEGDPTAARYIYPSAVFLLILVAGIAPDMNAMWAASRSRLLYGVSAGVLALTAIAVAFNIAAFQPGREDLVITSNVVRAQLGALDLAREEVDPEYTPPMQAFFGMPAAYFFSATDRFASDPAYSPAEIEASPDYARRRADLVSLRALRVHLGPAPFRIHRGRCTELRGRAPSESVDLSPAGLVIGGPGGAEVKVLLRRFGSGFSGPIQSRGPVGRAMLLRVQSDAERSRPWRAHLTPGRRPALLCTVARIGSR